jgi:Poxvirus A32 protein
MAVSEGFDSRLKLPFLMILAGPTSSGKTVFLTELLKHHVIKFDKIPDVVVYCYGEYLQDTFKALINIFGDKIQFIQGLKFDIEQFNPENNNLLIIDDLIQAAVGSKQVSLLFTRGSHHRNLSVVLISQNLYCQGKESITINRNAQYLVLFKNPRDVQQINCLGRQVGDVKLMQEAYKDATSRPYGYLFLDYKQTTPDEFRYRTNILPSEGLEYAYTST